jgi:hypothetical protein
VAEGDSSAFAADGLARMLLRLAALFLASSAAANSTACAWTNYSKRTARNRLTMKKPPTRTMKSQKTTTRCVDVV